MEHTPPEEPPGDDSLDDYYANLEELVIEQARRAINQSLYTKSLLSALPVAIIAADEHGEVRTLNRAAEQCLEVTELEMRGKKLEQLFEASPVILDEARQVIAAGRPRHLDGESVSLRSGERLFGNLSLTPIRDEEEELRGVVIIIEDKTQQHFLLDALKLYVPPAVSDALARSPTELHLGGEEKVLTVLLSDIKDFSSIAETRSPRTVFQILSHYFAEMTTPVFGVEGTLIEYVGDALLAVFGAPIHYDDHAARACTAALEMRRRCQKMRREWKGTDYPRLESRIGINTGPMLVGNKGSHYRFCYGVLGDHVNLAARLEVINKVYGTDIIIGENTAEMVEDRFFLRELDRVRVKGRKQTIRIYELLSSRESELPRDQADLLEHYAAGLAAYRERSWKQAIAAFARGLEHCPDDPPSRIMMKRCRDYLEEPPPEEWDGAYEQLTK